MSAREPRLVVLTGPSGAGKSTILAELRKDPRVFFSVSATTRPPRPGEVDGEDYLFYGRERFEREVAEGRFLEHAEVHGELYGTPRAPIESALADGRWAFLDIDVQGAAQLREQGVEGLFLLVRPPSLEALRARLEGRGTESEAQVARRLAAAREELARIELFDHQVVNDDLARATAEIAHLAALTDARGADGCS